MLPIVKWVGGKRQLLSEIRKYIPVEINTYYEPFVGGGAVLLNIQPQKAIVNDVNSELINVYTVIKEDVNGLINDLQKHINQAEYFYEVRSWDRDLKLYTQLTSVKRASRLIFLNKTCYNGLFRVNQNGQFNSPFGKYKNPTIVNDIALRAVSAYFNNIEIEFKSTDFDEALNTATKDDFVYLDPPYDPVSDSANFTGYAKGGFNKNDQIRLKQTCDKLTNDGIQFLLSNSVTDFILDLYKYYNIEFIKAKRNINCNSFNRGAVDEVLITNYRK